jgi:hypothetical protein
MRTKSGAAVVISIRRPGVVLLLSAGSLAAGPPKARHPVNPRAARLAFGSVARVSVRRSLPAPAGPVLNCGSRPAALRIFARMA